MSLAPQTTVLPLPGKSAFWAVSTDDLLPFLPAYASTLPGVLIPNWSYATYATCAMLSLTHATHMRVLGFCHTDQAEYYDWLTYYEPIIHRFVGVSAEITGKLKQLMPHRVADIVTRPYGVDVPPVLARPYSAAGSPIRLMYAGRLENTQKRISDLVALVEALTRQGTPFHLRVVGTGPEEGWLRTQFALATATASVTFEGSVPHERMAELWTDADVCVLVSNYEGTSIAMLEALARGCVPVVTDVSGTRDVVSQGTNGFTVAVGDLTAMAGYIGQLAADRTLLQAMGARAHHTALERYSIAAYVPWLMTMATEASAMPPRVWPHDRPLRHRRPEPVAAERRSVASRAFAKAKRMLGLQRASRVKSRH